MRSCFSPAGPIALMPTSRLPPNCFFIASNASGISMPHSSPAGSNVTSASRTTTIVGSAARPTTTIAS